jgi:transcriptional regulator with XRE-family HTH domain
MTGLELRRLRLSRGLTQQQAAEILGVSRSSVASYERGWYPIPARLGGALGEIAKLPKRDDPRLRSHAKGSARRARQHTLKERVCSVCGKEFRGPVWRLTCSARCLRRSSAAGRRSSGPRRPRQRTRRLLLDAMTGLFTIQELADAHGYTYSTVQTTLRFYGVRIPQPARPRPLTERQARIASRWLDGATMQEIAADLGTSSESVRQTLLRCGMTGRSRANAARLANEHREHMRRTRPAAATITPETLSRTVREAEGRALREARLAAGLTQDELAEVLGVRQRAVSSWESGQWALTRAAREWISRIDTAQAE